MKSDMSVNEVYDGFEEDRLSDMWGRKKFEERAVKIQSKIVRKCKRAVKITIHKGDGFEDNKGLANDTERDEIREEEYLWAKEGEAHSYSFSMFLPKNFPIVHTRLVLSQWKHHEDTNCASVNNPIIALRYNDGVFRITLQTSEEKINLFKTNKEIRGKWIDFKFEIKFTRKKSGFLKAWINKKQVIDYNGVTTYSEKYGYPFPGRFHFRFGLYRDVMDKPMTAYFDEYRKKKID